VPGKQLMYNLEVAQDHTYTVGQGQWVVHNKCDPSRLGRRLNQAGNIDQPGQNPHHIIPCALESHPLIQATQGKYDIDAAYNGRWMWPKSARTQALDDMEPYHGNAPRYKQYVQSLMNEEYQRLQSSGTLTPDAAFNSLMNITNQLNNWIDILGWFGALDGEACGLSG